MLKVKNKGMVREIAKITYKANKKRNLLTIFAIVLTTVLLSIVIVFGYTYWDTLRLRSIRTAGMDYDIELREPRSDQVNIIRSMDKDIKYAGLCVKCAVIEQYEDTLLDKERLFYLDETCWEKQTIPALEKYWGTYPQKENEIMFSTNALTTMGIKNPKIGMKLSLTGYYLAENKQEEDIFQKEFILSGYYRDYSNRTDGYISKAFYDLTGAKQTDFTQGTLKITLKNPFYSEKDILAIQKKIKLEDRQYIDADTDLISYFLKMIAALFGILFMIIISGYLFIYNSLYIFISKDIRYYGQLKTMGMTSKQLKYMIYYQTILNSVIGIPIGLFISAAVSKLVIPEILSFMDARLGIEGQVSGELWIFFFAGMFAFLINIVSSRKPAKMAGDCSPIEALYYLKDGIKGNKKRIAKKENSQKKEQGGLFFMAWQNIFRDKKQAVVIFSSFIIAISLFLIVNIVIRGNDGKRILNELLDYDIRFVNQTILEEEDKDLITEEKISQIKEISGVESVRKVISSRAVVPYQEEVYGQYYKELYEGRYSPGNYEKDIKEYKENKKEMLSMFESRLIAVDEEGFALLNKKAGNILDKKEFEDGKIALSPNFWGIGDSKMTGKTVRFFLPNGKDKKQEHSIKIAYVGGKYFNPATFSGGYTPELIISENYAKELLKDTITELIYVTYKVKFDKEIEAKVKKVFQKEREVSKESKIQRYLEMKNTELQIKVLGNSLSFIIAFLAIMNYINMMAANVQNRSREFATMESIGMTRKQIKKMLMLEGMGYAFISNIISLAIGLPLGYFVFNSLKSYQNAYSIPWFRNLAVFTIIFVLCFLLPIIIYQKTQKGSIIERIRENENF